MPLWLLVQRLVGMPLRDCRRLLVQSRRSPEWIAVYHHGRLSVQKQVATLAALVGHERCYGAGSRGLFE